MDGNANGNSTAASKTLTTTTANELLFGFMEAGWPAGTISEGSNQTEQWQTTPYSNYHFVGATKPQASPGAATMSFTLGSTSWEELVVALVGALSTAPTQATTTTYTYAGSGYASPDAVTQVSTMGLSTTTYSYDANGNLVQADGWSYMWDYLNRMLASGYNNSTTTYAYDPSGARVLQTSTTSTTYYPNKYYSFTSTKIGANTYATSTNYIWNGDTLLATIDQKLYNGAATGSPITRYIHPDHLGSTNAVTDQNGNLVQLMDYYPYGATRIATSTYPTSEKRQYIDQFSDTQTGLNYLNARYYAPSQGQFLTDDPVFLGDPKRQTLRDPQSLNAYSYSEDNPITKSDPQGLQALGGLDDLMAAYGVTDLLIPAIRAAIVTGAVNTDFNIAGNIVQNARQGQLTYNATPGSLLNSFGQGALFGATAETGAGFLTPYAKLVLAAKNAKLVSQGVSAAAVTAGGDLYSDNTNAWQIIPDISIAGLSTYGGATLAGIPRGSDVKSFSSPLFFNGANMSNAVRSGVASQSIQTFATVALSSIVTALKSLVSTLQAQHSQSSSK